MLGIILRKLRWTVWILSVPCIVPCAPLHKTHRAFPEHRHTRLHWHGRTEAETEPIHMLPGKFMQPRNIHVRTELINGRAPLRMEQGMEGWCTCRAGSVNPKCSP